MIPEPIAVTLQVAHVFEKIGVAYVLGGSLASARHGRARSTLDSDLVVELQASHIPQLVSELQADFYIDADMAYSAIRHQSSFNIIHLDTMFKVDLFIASQHPFDQAQINRRQAHALSTDPSSTLYVLTPEDTILAKLRWYRDGGEISERQLRDVQGIIEVQNAQLDWSYLEQMGNSMGLLDLIKQISQKGS